MNYIEGLECESAFIELLINFYFISVKKKSFLRHQQKFLQLRGILINAKCPSRGVLKSKNVNCARIFNNAKV